MKKFAYLALVAVTLMVGPVSGSVRFTGGSATQLDGSNATALIPEKVRAVLDKVRPSHNDAVKSPAIYVQSAESGRQHVQLAAITPDYYSAPVTRAEPVIAPEVSAPAEPGDWTLLPAALLLIGFIIRRRTAVR